MYTYNNSYNSNFSNLINGGIIYTVAIIVCFIIAIIAAIITYLLFMKKDNKKDLSGFAKSLYDFLHFKKLLSAPIVKILYIIATIFNTLYAIITAVFLVSYNILMSLLVFFVCAILINVLLRLIYEFISFKIIICKNTTEMNDKLSILTDGKNKSLSELDNFDDISSRRKYKSANEQNASRDFAERRDSNICPRCGRSVKFSTGVCQHCGHIL